MNVCEQCLQTPLPSPPPKKKRKNTQKNAKEWKRQWYVNVGEVETENLRWICAIPISFSWPHIRVVLVHSVPSDCTRTIARTIKSSSKGTSTPSSRMRG